MAQNADLIKQAMFEELQKILNPNGEIRRNAEERLAQLKYTEGYGIYLAEITINQSLDLALRQLASVMLKQYVEDCWTVEESEAETGTNGTLLVNNEAKTAIKTILPQGLNDPNSKIRSVVAYSISNIASYDWPNDWQELFGIIVKCLSSGNENSVHGAMKVLVEFTLDLDEKQIVDVGPMILSEVYRIFEAQTVYSVSTRSYAVEILHSMLRSITTHIESKQEQGNILNAVLPAFMQKMIEGLTVPNGPYSSFQLKTKIVKVLKYMISDMSKFANQYLAAILPPIWQLLTQMADVYIKVIVNETEESPFVDNGEASFHIPGDENEEFISMILQIFEFLHTIIEIKKYKGAITNVLTDLIYIVILYMQMTEEQVQSWHEDPEKFVEDEDEQGVDFTIRTTALDVLLMLGQEYDQKLLASFSEALGKHITVADADRNAGHPYWWKLYEASMLAVGSFKEMIVKNEDKFDLGQYMNLVKGIMEYQASPYLLGRCLWIISRYCDCNLFDQQTLLQVVNIIINSMSLDKPVVLRLTAARSIYGFCTILRECNDERKLCLVPKLEQFFECLMPLFSQSQNTVQSLLLETLTAIIAYDPNVTASISSKVVSLTIAMFLKYHDDRVILESVQDILKILAQNPFCLVPLQEKIIPTLVSILSSEGEQTATMHDIALDILGTVVKYSRGPLSSCMVESAFPAAVHCILRTEDASVMQSGGECLRAFLTVDAEQICGYKNGEGLNYIMEVTTMLLNPINTESTAAFIGRLVVVIITKVGNLLGENVDLLLKAVLSKMQLVQSLHVIMSLVIIFAHLIIVQMDAVLNFLSTVPGPTGEPAMSFVFANWLSRQHMFYGAYERKVCTMALCKLFEYGVTTKDERITNVMIKEAVVNVQQGRRTRSATASAQQEWVDVPILLKIFKLLLNELSNLKESKEALEQNGSESDESDSESAEPKGATNLSAMMLFDDDDEEDDDQQMMMQELMQNPIFQCDMQEYLVKFVQSFSCDEHFRVFLEKLEDAEKLILKGFGINVA
ncbi:importin-9-like isoform X2 [Culex pipiens pallens]|uniref:importin-9-like isoform X2 n=1 Tax=Culex pipiens pallens TaxID=42434 RepID=UPI00195327B2|nr:importin-9-like isoform X2 [Culex pipiens pallens]